MSYDIDLDGIPCPHCGKYSDAPECPNPTYNLTPIFHFALTGSDQPNPEINIFQEVILHQKTDSPRGLRILSGKKGRESIPMLETALHRLQLPENQGHLLSLEPENKWGTLSDAIYVIDKLKTLAMEYPDNVWRIR